MKTVAAVVIDKMAPLDLWGPIQAFQVAFATNPDEPTKPDSSKPLYKVITLGEAKGPVATGSGTGPAVMVDHSFTDDVDYDILLIPGGQGTRDLVNDADFIDSLKSACGKADIIATVCTGAGLLAKTGILDGKEATSNKTAWSWVLEQNSKVNWNGSPRWVDLVDGASQTGIITSAGVSAGIDMALALIAKLDGEQVAKNASVIMEYSRLTDPAKDEFAYLCAKA
ncbi:MAG: hypothetical protein BZY81_08265 [SAR202 cluster bacterium Io17-Chloro-G4]|nr:MAG: hypothetical protein BZY81_08265 [SAR202 cluster bacterium Io17-Chloro-G4]